MLRYRFFVFALAAASAFLPYGQAAAQNPARITFHVWTPEIGPVVDIAHCGDDRLFAVALSGKIHVITDSMTVLARPFLNLEGIVDFSGEKGLLGLAFAPDYATSGVLYTHYLLPIGAGQTVVSRWKVSSDPDSVDFASEEVIYTIAQPYTNHNGGDLDFGLDGMLYIPLGDGGSGGDPQNRAQTLSDPFGDILRLDVSDPDTTYTIPADNPFVTAGPDTLKEIWASGLRNPYRFGFDRLTGDIWLGDVGQNSWEEWDHLPAGVSGANFGWRCYEGDSVYDNGGCQAQSFYTAPAVAQMNDGLPGGIFCAAVGGRVYRGTQWPHLYGRYVYTDFCANEVRNLRPDGAGGWIDELSRTTVSTGWSVIAEDNAGELYIGNLGVGKVYRMVDQCPMDDPTVQQNGNLLSTDSAGAYQWYLDGAAVSGATAQGFEPGISGNVHVLVDFGNGCVLSTDTLAFIYTGAGGMELTRLSLSPVPVKDALTVRTTGAAVDRLSVIDARGRTVRTQPARGAVNEVNTSGLVNGHYLLRAHDATGAVIGSARFSVVR